MLIFAKDSLQGLAQNPNQGRRRADSFVPPAPTGIAEVAAELAVPIVVLGTLYMLYTRLRINIYKVLFSIFGTSVLAIIGVVAIIVAKGSCCAANPVCCIEEFFGEIIDLVTLGLVDTRCGLTALNTNVAGLHCCTQGQSVQCSAFPAECTGNIFDGTYGIYAHGCPTLARRLSCDRECESIDGTVVACGGCPLTRRALTPDGHAANAEELGAACYEVCLNGTALFSACGATWHHLGACGSAEHAEPGRQLREYFPDSAQPEIAPPRRLSSARNSKSAFASALASKVGLHFVRDGIDCDLSSVGKTPFEQFTDMMCILRASGGMDAHKGRALEDERLVTYETVRAVHDAAMLFQSRTALWGVLDGDPERASKVFASSALTDRVALWGPARRMVQSVVNAKLPDLEAVRRRAQEATAAASSGCADPTLLLCCDNSCQASCDDVQPLPGTVAAYLCTLRSAQQSLVGIDFGQVYADWEQCHLNHIIYPETDPAGPYASTSKVLVYCDPMLPTDWSIPYSTASTRVVVQNVGNNDQCPQYADGTLVDREIWFAWVSYSVPEIIFNFFVAAQVVVAFFTATLCGVCCAPCAYTWYGATSALMFVPRFWTRFFLLRDGFLGYGQEFWCMFLHTFSISTTLFFIVVGVATLEFAWPIVLTLTQCCGAGRCHRAALKAEKYADPAGAARRRELAVARELEALAAEILAIRRLVDKKDA